MQLPGNPLGYGAFMRALLVALFEWVERGVAPPDSRFPSRADGMLLTLAEARATFPKLPQAEFPKVLNELRLRDHSVEPPIETTSYPVFVQATDADGNALGGIGVEAFVNMSQMTVTQMSITVTTESPQHKLHWLAEQALSWSGLPVVTVRPTVFLEGFFLLFAAASVCDADELAVPMGAGKTSPVSSVDVARAVAVILDDPAPHIGHIYDLTGPESADLDHYAHVYSEVLGRTIRYRDAPTSEWSEKLRAAGLPEHVVHHLTVMTELHK
jgi:uncharacterized protein YbjT (DUF2867 family)